MRRNGYIKRDPSKPLRSKKGLVRTGGPQRKGWIQRSRKPLPTKRRKENFGPQAKLCRTLPCCACGSPPPSDPDHVRTRGAGGKDLGNVVPLCRRCHSQRHDLGLEWIRETYGVDLAAEAAALAKRVREES